MNQENQPFFPYKSSSMLLAKEEMLELTKKCKPLTIGLAGDETQMEKRISLVPNAVGLLVQNGHKLLIERDSGERAWFSNHEYAEYGGEIVDKTEAFKADIVIKVASLTLAEIEMLKPKSTIITSLQLSTQAEEYFRRLMSKKITSLSFEYIQDKTKAFPIRRAMSEMAGTASIITAAEYLSNPEFGKGHILGGFSGISPTEVVILGAGTVGEYAAKAALGMGAMVKIFDNSIYKLKALQNHLIQPVFTSVIQPNVVLKALKTADVLIAAISASSGRTPVFVSEEMVSQMKPGSVIIDVSIDQGGCVETSQPTDHRNPVFIKHGVTHYCVPNIASRFPHTASYAISNFLAPILLVAAQAGGIEPMLHENEGIRRGTYMFNGLITNRQVSDYFRLPYQEIELLLSAF